jgi:tetratricopeptide (TPR) repeat protein
VTVIQTRDRELKSPGQRQPLVLAVEKIAIIALACLLVYPLSIGAFRLFYSEMHVFRAVELVNTRLYYETEDDALKALKENPQDGYAHYFLGAFYRKQGRLEDANREISASLRTIQHPATALRVLGEIAFTQNDFERAVAFLRRALTIDPEPILEPAVQWYLLGKAAFSMRDFATAIFAFHEADRLRMQGGAPTGAAADLARLQAQSYASLGIYSRALFHFSRHLATKPDDALAAFQMAEAYRLAGEAGRARGILEKLDGAGVLPLEGYRVLAGLFIEKNDLPGAAGVFERAKERFPDAATTYFILGEIYARMGNRELMRKNYEQHLRLMPQSPQRARIEQQLKAKP